MIMKGGYPQLHERIGALMAEYSTESPDTMAAFGGLHQAAIADGALSGKVKELIALGIAITVRCDGCIAYHVHDALESGALHAEIVETIGVAILMGGGPSVVYGTQALQALKEFESEG